MSVEKLRRWIIEKCFKTPVLGENYVDWHAEDGVCGVSLCVGGKWFVLTIREKS